VVLAFAAGCGGDGDRLSQQEYEQRVNEVGSNIEGSFEDLGQAFQGGDDQASLDEAAAQIGDIQEEIRTQADELDGVEPPENAQEEHDQLVEGLDQLAGELDEFRTAVEEGDAQAIQRFGQEFQESEGARKIQEAGEGLEEKGYELTG
jgi:soluble cytochrome b562